MNIYIFRREMHPINSLSSPQASSSLSKLNQNPFKPQECPQEKPGSCIFSCMLPFAVLSSYSLLFWTTTENEGKQMMAQNQNNKTRRQSGCSSYHKGDGCCRGSPVSGNEMKRSRRESNAFFSLNGARVASGEASIRVWGKEGLRLCRRRGPRWQH